MFKRLVFSSLPTLSLSTLIARRSLHDAVIVSAVRTPVGSFQGALASLKAPQLGSKAVAAAIREAKIAPTDVTDVILGNVLQAGQGQAPARQAALGARLPEKVNCTTINKVCASGMKSVTLAAQGVMLGHATIVVAGGFESMSNVPFYLDGRARSGLRLGDGKLIDGIVHDGLWDVYNNFHMGNCGEHCAKEYKFTRQAQDEYATQSYKRAADAWAKGLFKNEIVPVEVAGKTGPTLVTEDEEYKKVNFEKLASLKPAFAKDGTITAANASKINDGASAFVVMSSEESKKRGLKPLAKILGFADAECAPIDFTIAPAQAIPIALQRAGLKKEDIDLWEINEAFSVVAMVNQKLLGLDPAKINAFGGAVSLGHPIGSSGGRILATLAHQLRNSGKRYGCAAICNGGGGATAVVIERL